MSTPARYPFRGTPWMLGARGLLWAIPAGLLLNLLFLGRPAWGLLALFAAAISLLGLVAFPFLRHFDRIGWSDDREQLIRPHRRPIAVGEISALQLIQQGPSTRLILDLRGGGHRVAGPFFRPTAAARFEQTFREYAKAPVVRSHRPEWLAVLILILAVVIVAAGARLWLASTYPLAAAPCQSPSVEAASASLRFTARGLAFALPPSFTPITANAQNTSGFADEGTGTRVFVHAAAWDASANSPLAPSVSQRTMLAVMGLPTWTSVLTWAHCNRWGVLPRFVKALLLGANGFGPNTELLLERSAEPHASLFRLRQDHRGVVAELTLANGQTDLGWFVITGREAGPVREAASLIRATVARAEP